MKRWQFWIGVSISAALLVWALRRVDLAAAWQAALTARWGYLVLGWLCLLSSYLARSWRWQVILRPVGQLPLWTVMRVFMAGFMANNLLPARIGEVVRATLLGQAAALDSPSALGTVAVERLFDVAMTLALLAVGAATGVLGEVAGSVWLGGAAVSALFVGVLALVLWGTQLCDLLERAVGRVSTAWGKRLADVARSFVRGLRAVGSLGRVFQVALWSGVAWGLIMAYAHFVLLAYGLHPGAAGLAFLLGVAGVGVSIPSAPGNVGTLEYAYMLGLQVLGVGDESTRASFALTYHALEWVTTCAIGLLCLGQLGLSPGQLSAVAEGKQRAKATSAGSGGRA